ncbi:hypothetical protein GA0074696_3595 [Micromonospora purpureochromogenes]|uniref:Uncharacterized protein n=1 Tax=Micromonospora purpureochromogenes TaxID=47872 RepID=A0A1C4YQF4_9ACTN|nr:hypothetical protein [Micromonospora purpureochromogenes]SCF22924.1 hypothetical protein GA0074696_3595 [Micromonospora purpureochromogenes]
MSAVVTGTDRPDPGYAGRPGGGQPAVPAADPGVVVDPLPRRIALAAAREVEGPCGTL